MRYLLTVNKPGFLPEGESGTFHTYAQAFESLVKELDNTWDATGVAQSEYETALEEAGKIKGFPPLKVYESNFISFAGYVHEITAVEDDSTSPFTLVAEPMFPDQTQRR